MRTFRSKILLVAYIVGVLFWASSAHAINLPGCSNFGFGAGDVYECVDTPGMNWMMSGVCIATRVMVSAGFNIECIAARKMRPVLEALVTLYVVIYTMAVIFNVMDISLKDGMFRYIKVAFIFGLVAYPNMWAQYFFYPIINFWFTFLEFLVFTPELVPTNDNGQPLINVDDYPEGMWYFALINVLAQTLVGDANTVSMTTLGVAFLFTGIYSWLGVLLLLGVISIVLALVNIAVTFATASIGVVFLTMLFPFFGIFLLFKATRRIWNGYIAGIISFAMQTIIILFYLILLFQVYESSQFINQVRSDVVVPEPGEGDDYEVVVADPATAEPQTEPEYVLLQSWVLIKSIGPKINGLSSDPDLEDPRILKEKAKYAVGWVLVFIIMNGITNAFLRESSLIAHQLSVYQNYFVVPVIGQSRALEMGAIDKGRNLEVANTSGARGAFDITDGLPKDASGNVKETKVQGALREALTDFIGGGPSGKKGK